MTVQQIYEKYRIMPDLQLHQLRVTAVGKTLAEHIQGTDVDSITRACLFHDMGNIIKADFTAFPDFIPESEVPRWKAVKEDYIARYGDDEHHATHEIGKEIGLSSYVLDLMECTRFSRLPEILETGTKDMQIIIYADQRAAPRSIASLSDRLAEGRARYAEKKGYNTPEGAERFARCERAGHELEKKLFETLDIRPEDLTESGLSATMESLRSYEVS